MPGAWKRNLFVAAASFAHQRAKSVVKISEVLKWTRGGPFFSRKEHGDKRAKEKNGCGDLCPFERNQMGDALASSPIADLVVGLDIT